MHDGSVPARVGQSSTSDGLFKPPLQALQPVLDLVQDLSQKLLGLPRARL